MKNRHYFIIDTQKLFTATTGSSRILDAAEKLRVTKFFMRDAMIKHSISSNVIVRSMEQNSYEGNFLEPFVVDEKTNMYVNERHLLPGPTRIKNALERLNNTLNRGVRYGSRDSMIYKNFYITPEVMELPKQYKASVMDVPELLGRVIVECKEEYNWNSAIVIAMLNAFNLNYRREDAFEGANINHALFTSSV